MARRFLSLIVLSFFMVASYGKPATAQVNCAWWSVWYYCGLYSVSCDCATTQNMITTQTQSLVEKLKSVTDLVVAQLTIADTAVNTMHTSLNKVIRLHAGQMTSNTVAAQKAEEAKANTQQANDQQREIAKAGVEATKAFPESNPSGCQTISGLQNLAAAGFMSDQFRGSLVTHLTDFFTNAPVAGQSHISRQAAADAQTQIWQKYFCDEKRFPGGCKLDAAENYPNCDIMAPSIFGELLPATLPGSNKPFASGSLDTKVKRSCAMHFIRNIAGALPPEPISQGELMQAGGRTKFAKMQQIEASRSAAAYALADIASSRMEGPPGSDKWVKEMTEGMGFDVPPNVSQHQLDSVLFYWRYMHPQWYLLQYGQPANVQREIVHLKAAEMMIGWKELQKLEQILLISSSELARKVRQNRQGDL